MDIQCRCEHVLALGVYAKVYAWGGNEYGQCGNGSEEKNLTSSFINCSTFFGALNVFELNFHINPDSLLFRIL